MGNDPRRFERLFKQGFERLSRKRLAKTEGQLRLAGLCAPVEVIRDRWGVAHIYAAEDRDLFFAQGFVHAQDRFWQMDFQRRLAAGRLSELVGRQTLDIDRWMRVVGLHHIAEQEAGRLTKGQREMLDAYTAGVNAWLGLGNLPVEYAILRNRPRPWQVTDSLAWSKMMAWMLSANWECELLRQQIIDKLGPERAETLNLRSEESWPIIMTLPEVLRLKNSLPSGPRTWAGPGEGVGSNNWVISGARTATGKPILANDMHLSLSAPAIWYENHLSSANFNATGVSLPGVPLVIAGHNGQIAWGFTAGFSDVQDLYMEHLRFLDAAGPDHAGGNRKVEYEYQGEWRPADVRREVIQVRAGSPVVEEIITTHHGPIISSLLGQDTEAPLALCWTAYETGGGTLQALLEVNQARNCLEFHEALRTWSMPVLNAVYADTDGNIGYTLAGSIPNRAGGDGKTPVPGWTGTYEWTGLIPFDALPHLYNPPAGYIATANNRTAGPDYPYFLGRDYVCSDRAERIVELILQQPEIDLDYVRQMQFDQLSPSARDMARIVGQMRLDTPALREAAALLRDWDGHLEAGSPAAALYEALVRELLWVIFEDALGEHMPRFAGTVINEVTGTNLFSHQAWEWLRHELHAPHSPWLDSGSPEARADVLQAALQRAVTSLITAQGLDASQWNWGHYHQLTFQHVLGRVGPFGAVFNRGPYPVGGDANTIWATASLLDRLDSSAGMVGPPFRFIADLSNLGGSIGLLAPGNSGQVGSPHYADQVEAWFQAGYHPMLYRREDVLHGQEALLRLLPDENPIR